MSAPKEFIDKLIDYMVKENGFCRYPISLSEINYGEINYAWSYHRSYGLFPVDLGSHAFVNSYLFALSIYDEMYNKWINYDYEYVEDDFFDQFTSECLDNIDEWADKFLEIKGTAFLSGSYSCDHILIGSSDSLNRQERLVFEGSNIITMDDYYKNDSLCL